LRKGENGELDHLAIGELGERIAAAWLRGRGRKVLCRNFEAPHGGEIDIVARDGEVLCFVEVKTRTSRAFGRPLDAVDESKQRLQRRGADEWLRMLGRRDIPWRFDVVEVILEDGVRPDVNLVENAFTGG
jgi:putative endonuclease